MKTKIETILNDIREEYMFMLVGRKPKDYEELLFQMDERIREVLNETKEEQDNGQ